MAFAKSLADDVVKFDVQAAFILIYYASPWKALQCDAVHSNYSLEFPQLLLPGLDVQTDQNTVGDDASLGLRESLLPLAFVNLSISH